MATYSEIRDLFFDDALKNKIDTAVIIAANDLLVGTPTTAQQQWAAHAFSATRTETDKALKAVLAANKASSVAQIQGASDAAIQTNVDSVVDTLVVAFSN